MAAKSGNRRKEPDLHSRAHHSNRVRNPKALALPNRPKAKAAKAIAASAATGADGVAAVVATVLRQAGWQVPHQQPLRREVDRCMAGTNAACGRVQR